MKITKLLTPYNKTTKSNRNIKYIVIHYVGATGGAEANCKYYASKYVGSSAHYFVGHKGEVYQSVEDKDIAWHCGAKNYRHADCRNTNAIGIELCCRNNGQWYFEQETIEAGIELTKELMKKYNIGIDNVIRHYEVTGKCCPAPMVNNPEMWQAFKKALVEETKVEIKPVVEAVKQEATAQKTPSIILKVGGKGNDVKKLQENLNKLGYSCGVADGIFGEATKKAVLKYQRANNLAVDGIVGAKTLASIESNLNKIVKQEDNIVARLQRELNAQYKAGLKVDGIFGTKTLNACPIVKKGAKGNITKIIQEQLRDRHDCFSGQVDGIFGASTKKYVESFQSYYKIKKDGIVGKQTWDKLF